MAKSYLLDIVTKAITDKNAALPEDKKITLGKPENDKIWYLDRQLDNSKDQAKEFEEVMAALRQIKILRFNFKDWDFKEIGNGIYYHLFNKKRY